MFKQFINEFINQNMMGPSIGFPDAGAFALGIIFTKISDSLQFD